MAESPSSGARNQLLNGSSAFLPFIAFMEGSPAVEEDDDEHGYEHGYKHGVVQLRDRVRITVLPALGYEEGRVGVLGHSQYHDERNHKRYSDCRGE